MRAEYINLFIASVDEVFSTMLNSEVLRRAVTLSKGEQAPTELTALVGWSGPARGTVALVLPEHTALALAQRLLDTAITEMDDTVMDAVSEIVNIVAGSAKARFSESQGIGAINLSLPTVVYGARYNVQHPTQAKWVEVPFQSDLGAFSLRVTFEAPRPAHAG